MTRGYLKTDGDAKRLRFVMPGYDADDPDTPPNKVIFDSKDIGTLSILAAGEKVWTGVGQTDPMETIATWELDFVPLCTFQFYESGGHWRHRSELRIGGNRGGPRIIVSKTGIQVDIIWLIGTPSIPFKIRWQAYRLAAA